MQRTAVHQVQQQGAARMRSCATQTSSSASSIMLKHFRAIATRDGGLTRNFLAGVRLAVTIFPN